MHLAKILFPANKSRRNGQRRRSAPAKKGNKNRSRQTTNRGPAVTGTSRTDTSTVVRMIQAPLFPVRSKNVMLPYYSTFNLSVPNTGLAAGYVFAANGLYDPDITGTGSQPMGFDQMMIFYEHYTVTRCTLIATFRNTGTLIAPGISIAAKADTTLQTDPYSIMEQGNSLSSTLNIGTAANGLKELRMNLDVKRFLGIDDLMDSSVARGDIASNPAEGLFFHLSAWSLDAASAGTVSVAIRLEYHAVFTELRIINRSLAHALHTVISASNRCDSVPETKVCSQPTIGRRL